MLKTLQAISKNALLLNECDFNEQKLTSWLGNKAATDEQIKQAEIKLHIKFPADYVKFLKISNGFLKSSRTGVGFSPIEKVDYLINVDEDLIEAWEEHGDKEIAKALKKSLIIGGLSDEQYLLLIPTQKAKEKWKYWLFANWIPGEEEFKNLEDYLNTELTFLEKATKGLKEPKPRLVIDYSLRDQVFNHKWKQVFENATKFLNENRNYYYFNGSVDLFSLLLIAADKLNYFENILTIIQHLRSSLKSIKKGIDNPFLNEVTLDKFEEAAQNNVGFISDFQKDIFVINQNSITIEQIENLIKIHRKDLLKLKNKNQKTDYQLYFLFAHGNVENFINVYEVNFERVSFDSHFNAAIVYTTINQIQKAKDAIQKYFEVGWFYKPLAPFLNKNLITLMDKNFSRDILKKMSKLNSE